jgi:cation-transporting ATPase 13A2
MFWLSFLCFQPLLQTPLPTAQSAAEPNFDYAGHAKHVLFCGTDLRRVKGTARALVVRTGYHTAKGALIRQILYPKPSVFPFYRDALIFIFVLFIITMGAFGWAIWKFVSNGASWWFTTLRVLDLFTTVIPPALPIAMSAGASFAVLRLRQAGIYCIVPKTINIAGRVNVFAFDKTGTLTQDHLDVQCVRPVSGQGQFLPETRQNAPGNLQRPLAWALAACHTVVRLSPQETIGDPLEVKMMQWTGWTCSSFDDPRISMSSPDQREVVYTLVRHEFMSQLARMSVVVRAPDNEVWALAKGAPEELRRRCVPQTVPTDFDAVLASYTAQGMRTIALAAKPMKEAAMHNRDEVEAGLNFLGLLVMVNPLKPETPEMLRLLQAARIRVVMITGDNALTAVNVARKAGMSHTESVRLIEFDKEELRSTSVRAESMEAEPALVGWDDVLTGGAELALTGAAFANLCDTQPPGFVQTVLRRATIYARTNPLQKTQIVTLLKQGGVNTVGMCGDGANDCGALKVRVVMLHCLFVHNSFRRLTAGCRYRMERRRLRLPFLPIQSRR